MSLHRVRARLLGPACMHKDVEPPRRPAIQKVRRTAISRLLRHVLPLCALLALLGCSPSNPLQGLWYALQLPVSNPGNSEGPCLDEEPTLKDGVDPASVMRWAPTVCAVFDPADAATALCIISYESGGDPNLTNRDDPARGSLGLMQINSDWWIGSEYHAGMVSSFGRSDEAYLAPAVNVAAAALLVNDPELPGWHSWATSRSCPHHHHHNQTV